MNEKLTDIGFNFDTSGSFTLDPARNGAAVLQCTVIYSGLYHWGVGRRISHDFRNGEFIFLARK